MAKNSLLTKKLTTIPKFSIYLDVRSEKKDKTYPLKIRATIGKTRKYYSINANSMNNLIQDIDTSDLSSFIYDGKGDYSLSKEVFGKVTDPKARGKFKEMHQILSSLENEAQEIARQCRPFSFEVFRDKYVDKEIISIQTNDAFVTMKNYIRSLHNQNQIRTEKSYKCALRSLQMFHGKEVLPFENITISFLEKYEAWMKDEGVSGRGNSRTTIGIYMKPLRAVFNMRPKALDGLQYPFGAKKYQIPVSKGRKIALNTEDLKKVFNYKPKPGTLEEYYLDFWKLQYLMNGINITDLLLLKYQNIKEGFISFERHKTERTKKDAEEIRIPYSDTIKSFLKKYSQPRKTDKTYILPIIKPSMSPEEKDKAILYFANMVTKRIKKVAKVLELNEDVIKKISSYASRHTFASTLMKKNAPASYIKQQLGHTSLETTTNYLSSFEDKQLEEWQEKLTEF